MPKAFEIKVYILLHIHVSCRHSQKSEEGEVLRCLLLLEPGGYQNACY